MRGVFPQLDPINTYMGHCWEFNNLLYRCVNGINTFFWAPIPFPATRVWCFSIASPWSTDELDSTLWKSSPWSKLLTQSKWLSEDDPVAPWDDFFLVGPLVFPCGLVVVAVSPPAFTRWEGLKLVISRGKLWGLSEGVFLRWSWPGTCLSCRKLGKQSLLMSPRVGTGHSLLSPLDLISSCSRWEASQSDGRQRGQLCKTSMFKGMTV